MEPLTYRITTLGCRVNHAEARELESTLLGRGLVRAAPGAPADLEVVHSCSVTSTAAAKSRHAVRRAAARQAGRQSSGSGVQPLSHGSSLQTPQVIVTGCFAATHPESAGDLAGGSEQVLPHEAADGSSLADRFAARLDEFLAHRPSRQGIRTPLPGSSNGPIKRLPVVPPVATAGAHVRAELRVQDGCDAHCTFCIVPSIRSTLRSKSIPDAVDEARRLVELGHKEVVLTGIFIGAYGHETALRRRQANRHVDFIADLLDAVAHVEGLRRLRLSSMEPGDVTETLLDAMIANAPVIVPHLHLPLQSGSDAILKRMNRQYRMQEYLEMIDRVNAALTGEDGLPPAITTDILCGFPGELEADFQQTVAVAQRVGYLHMHVFPYSPRPGTAAARWTDRFVPESIARARVRRLIDLENDGEDGLSIRYRRRLLGRTVRVIIEQPDKDDPALMTGRCDQYALIHLRTDQPRGSLVTGRVIEVTATRTLAEAVTADAAIASLPVIPR